ncbi:LLM class flavin-dependent oxidoreductase [Baekduia soli]|uniref:LLM class flavin-dependent oxidoreductase n=1 Tax=Baekduia soli TaxID=496014 RepID=A0A5B8U1Y2_9ACTN|nr:LLM class flavin-dependent oxidoreductase [Baekduia soli]QEC47059.1 LLM class flavin-dependent oxidoreductase [Baekduia soli]
MRYAVVVPNWAPFTQDVMIQIAVEAEALGYDHVFYTDHIMNPYAEKQGLEETTVESWSLISHVAAKTSTIRLGTAVTPISLRPPALLAKQIATIDNLSGGRIDVGVGVGWSEGSYGVLDTEFGTQESRIARMREGVDLMLRLWTEDRVDFDGQYYKAHDAVVAPKPVQQPHPPLWVGGWKEPARSAVSEVGQGWIPWNLYPDRYAANRALIEEAAQALGRADQITYGTAVLVLPDRMRDDPDIAMAHGKPPPHITASTMAPTVQEYAGAGADLFAVFPFPASDALDVVRQFAAQML